MELNLYVHGWTTPATEDDLRRRFEGLPGVAGIKRIALNKKNFAHVDLQVTSNPEEVMAKLQSVYKNAKWKGGLLKFETGRPEFLVRLNEEKEQREKEQSLRESGNRDSNRRTVEDLLKNGGLRIRMRKGLSLKRKSKKPLLIAFNNSGDVDHYDYNWDQDKLPQHGSKKQRIEEQHSLPIPESQHAAFCCTAGDAGPTTEVCVQVSEIRPAPATETRPISVTTETVPTPVALEKEEDDEFPTLPVASAKVDAEDDLVALASFVSTNKVVPSKPKKVSPKSLLGMWFEQTPASNSDTDS